MGKLLTSPTPKILGYLVCYKVSWSTSKNPFSAAKPASFNLLSILPGIIEYNLENSFVDKAPVLTSLTVAYLDFDSTLISS